MHNVRQPASETLRLVHVATVPHAFVFLKGQLRLAAEKGFEVHAIASAGAEWESFIRHEQVATHVVPMLRRITPFADLLALWRLYRLLRRIRPHIVHGHTPKAGLLSMLAAWLAGVPVRIYTLHGLRLMTTRGWKRHLLRWTERVACNCANRVLSVSHSIRTIATRLRICPSGKIAVLLGGSSNGVDARGQFDPLRFGTDRRRAIRRQCNIPEDALVAAFVGRMVPDKGMVELAEAWQTLRQRLPSLHLLLVGRFETENPLPPEVETLFHNDARIHLVPYVEDVAPYYAATDVLVLPTYREGLPGVVLEAGAMKVPVVATRVPGCIDAVIDGVTGVLVPPRDWRALARALETYLLNPALRSRHGEAGRERALQCFRREAICEAIFGEYDRLLVEAGIAVPERPESVAPPLRRAA